MPSALSSLIASASLLLLLLPAAPALAQGEVFAAVTDMTVDGDPPPDRYRGLLETGLRPTLQPVLDCYRNRAGRVAGLRGELRLRMWVSARQVIRVTPETTLSDQELQTCAIAAVRTFRLPDEAPDGGASVRLTLRFTQSALPASRSIILSARGPIIAPPPPPAVIAPPRIAAPPPAPLAPATIAVESVTGARTAADVAQAITRDSLAPCATVAGDLRLRISISSTGIMRASRVGGSVRDARAVACVRRAIRALPALPRVRGSSTAMATVSLRADD